MKRLLLPVLLLALWPSSAVATPLTSVKVTGCDPDAGTAEFRAVMRTVPDATQLQMRFTLQVREEDGWDRVPAPTFDSWRSAEPGKLAYDYRKLVQGLSPGDYRVVVRFRWRDAEGAVVRQGVRRSKPCAVPDERPDLVPLKVKVGPGPTPQTRAYTVTVANRGRSAAESFAVGLAVDGMPLADQALDGLEPGDKASVVFTGAPCEDTLVATVDAEGLVEEAEEADDVLSVACDAGR